MSNNWNYLFLQLVLHSSSFLGTLKNETSAAALQLSQLEIKQFLPDILKFSTKIILWFQTVLWFLGLVCLYFIQACVDWVLIVFGTQVINKKRPVRPVFLDYLSVSYDYNFFDVVKNRTSNKFAKINLKEIESSCRSTHQRCSIKKRCS